MIPATLRVIDELPRLPNLKVDRVKLARIDAEAHAVDRAHLRLALPVDLLDLPELDDGPRRGGVRRRADAIHR